MTKSDSIEKGRVSRASIEKTHEGRPQYAHHRDSIRKGHEGRDEHSDNRKSISRESLESNLTPKK